LLLLWCSCLRAAAATALRASGAPKEELLAVQWYTDRKHGRGGTAGQHRGRGATGVEHKHRRAGEKHRAVLRAGSLAELGIVHKTEYWGTLSVGNPPTRFTVIFDTGSGNLILPSSACKSRACLVHRRYDPKNSSSGVQVAKNGKPLAQAPDVKRESSVKFGTGKIHGQFYQDRVCLGKDSACMSANFIGTDVESDSPFEQCNFDGIMGLGFKDLSMGSGFNMVDDMVAQHSLASNRFSVYLTDKGGSAITFGGYRKEKAATEPVWVPVSHESYWQIRIEDMMFDNRKTGLCPDCQVAVDTGTSLLAGPSDVVEQLNSRLGLKEDCSNFDSLPLLGFAIGDKVLNLRPDDYIDRDDSQGTCSISLMSLDVPPPKGPLFIFGDPFLRRFLTVYDRDGPKVGFAVAKHEGMRDEDVAQLIATADSGATKAADGGASGDADAGESSPETASVVESAADEDPFKALDAESSSWSMMASKLGPGLRSSAKAASGAPAAVPGSKAGMLQVEKLVDVSLERTRGGGAPSA